MQMVYLRGKFNGFVRFDLNDGGMNAQVRGMPNGIELFVVQGNKPIAFTPALRGNFEGAIVVDEKGNIIADGRTRGGSNIAAKAVLLRNQQSEEVHSEALDSIIDTAKRLFAEPAVPVEQKRIKEWCANNPFYETYPDSEWRTKRDRTGAYLEGVVHIQDIKLRAIAIPAIRFSEIFFEKRGFNRIVRAYNGELFRLKLIRIE